MFLEIFFSANHWFGVFLFDPLLCHVDMLLYLCQLVGGGKGSEFFEFILAAVQFRLVVVLHLVYHAHVQVH